MSTYQWHPGHLRELPEDECRELLALHHVGRVAWCDDDGPVVLPVNYEIVDDHVVFRTSAHSQLARRFPVGGASFQIDEIDEFTRSGWSVLVRGRAEVVAPADLGRDADRPEPWAAGARNVVVRIAPARITGRRVFPS